MCGHMLDIVIYSRFHQNPFRGFGAKGLKFALFTTACTTVQDVKVTSIFRSQVSPYLAFTTACTTVQDVKVTSIFRSQVSPYFLNYKKTHMYRITKLFV